jgi:hypothetical protein
MASWLFECICVQEDDQGLSPSLSSVTTIESLPKKNKISSRKVDSIGEERIFGLFSSFLFSDSYWRIGIS